MLFRSCSGYLVCHLRVAFQPRSSCTCRGWLSHQMHRYVLPVTLSLSDDPPTRLPFSQGVIALAVGFCIRHTGVFYQSHLGYLVFQKPYSGHSGPHVPARSFQGDSIRRMTHRLFTLGPIKLLPENLPVSRPYWEQVPGGEHGFSLLPRPTSP